MSCIGSAVRLIALLEIAAGPLCAQASRDGAADVQVEMRHVDYRVDSTITHSIDHWTDDTTHYPLEYGDLITVFTAPAA